MSQLGEADETLVRGVAPPQGHALLDPIFVYGFLKPEEIAHSVIQHLLSEEPLSASVPGKLVIKDGLPLYQAGQGSRVFGSILRSDPMSILYEAIGEFEPQPNYMWRKVMTTNGAANILEGKALAKGTTQRLSGGVFRSSADPLLAVGPGSARAMLQVSHRVSSARYDQVEFWHHFFQVQMAYTLLWSVVERFTALRYGPRLTPGAKVRRFSEDPAFCSWLETADITENDSIYDARGIGAPITLSKSNARSSALYFYQIRNNLSHRGKTAEIDLGRLGRATTYLCECVEHVLRSYGITEENFMEIARQS